MAGVTRMPTGASGQTNRRKVAPGPWVLAALVMAVPLVLVSLAWPGAEGEPEAHASQIASYASIPMSTGSDTPTPGPTCTPANYTISQSSGATVVPGTTAVLGSGCDQCSTTISLPFAYTLYDQAFNSAIVGDNGTLGFVSNGNDPNNTCLPYAGASYA